MFICKIKDLIHTDVFEEEDRVSIDNFLKNNDMRALLDGSYALGGENKVKVMTYDTKAPNSTFEGHKDFADVQYIICGEERLSVAREEDCTLSKEYNEEKDVVFFEGEACESAVLLADGEADCAVFLPGELHQPNVWVNESSKVKKAVFKILIK